MELQIVSKLVRELECQGSPIPTIAILSPYNAQVDRLAGNNGLKAVLPSESPNIPGLAVRNSVHSVDSFQGNEADLVVLSLVRNNSFGGPHNAWGFVLNPERLNVMLSRARLQLIVVGCSTLIVLHSAHESMKPLVDVLDYFRRFGRVISCRELGLVFP
jgi:superfamily I DNA and/or RNA helicase